MSETAVLTDALRGSASPSEAGPLDALDDSLGPVPELPMRPTRQSLNLVFKMFEFYAWAERQAGDVFRLEIVRQNFTIVATSHPDHAKSLFLAKPNDAPSSTGESPLRPVVGPSTVLTSIGARHMRQRKLLLPSFHGDSVAAYTSVIEDAITKEVDSWSAGSTIELAPRMSDVTLDVIMAGVFGAVGPLLPGSVEAKLRKRVRTAIERTTKPWWFLAEQSSAGHDSPRFPLSLNTTPVYNALDEVVAARRAIPEAERGKDILSLLLSARDEDGIALTDLEVRMELLTLVLAGHETTANSLAWTMERLVRNPDAYTRLRESVRIGGPEADAYIDAVIHEAMRVRPVIPMVGRRVQRPWRLGDCVVPADSLVAVSIVLLHRREDIYPRPLEFLPERFLDAPPSTYEWIPFGGGIRRCLGVSLAMAELRVVLRELSRRVDMSYDKPEPERERFRNVTLIPSRGGRVHLNRVAPS